MVELHYWLVQTMLIERLAGVSLYAGLLGAMYLLLRSAKDHKAVCRILNAYAVVLCIMAFFYIPGEEADLGRWRDVYAEYWRSLTFSEFVENHMMKSTTPVAYFYIFIFQRTGIDGLLPAFCALVFYGNLFYILKDLNRRHHISAWSISTVLLFLMAGGGFLEVISGVRCFVSLSIMARCFYNEIYNGKPIVRNLPWEIIASLTHSMALILLGGRFVFLLLQKRRSPLMKLLSIAFAAVLIAGGLYLGRNYISGAMDKLETYLSGENDYTYFWEYLLGAFMIVQFLIILSKGKWTMRRNPDNHELRNMIVLNWGVLAAEFVLVMEYNSFHRINLFSTLMLLPVAAETIEDEKNPGLDRVIGLLSLFILLFACARGNLSGYKFLEPR